MRQSIAILFLLASTASAEFIRQDFAGVITEVDPLWTEYYDADVGDPLAGWFEYWTTLDEYGEAHPNEHFVAYDYLEAPKAVVQFGSTTAVGTGDVGIDQLWLWSDQEFAMRYDFGGWNIHIVSSSPFPEFVGKAGHLRNDGLQVGMRWEMVPEPSTWLMLAMAIPMMCRWRVTPRLVMVIATVLVTPSSASAALIEREVTGRITSGNQLDYLGAEVGDLIHVRYSYDDDPSAYTQIEGGWFPNERWPSPVITINDNVQTITTDNLDAIGSTDELDGFKNAAYDVGVSNPFHRIVLRYPSDEFPPTKEPISGSGRNIEAIYQFVIVPEPTTWLMLAMALPLWGLHRSRKDAFGPDTLCQRRNSAMKRTPKVTICRPKGRHYQIRYADPITGKDVRKSVGCRDASLAQQMKAEIEAKLTLGVDPTEDKIRGESMSWDSFRDEYSRLHLATLREETAANHERRLNVCERIIRPRSLKAMAKPSNLERLKAELLIGSGSRRKNPKPRSPHSVNGYLRVLVASLNWAHRQHWLPDKVAKQVIPADDPAKGRPLCLEEFERMLDACLVVCGDDAFAWQYLLWGLWESGLRVAEAMNLSFDLPDTIQVVRQRSSVVLEIPGKRQKNRRQQTIPTIPTFVEVLDKHPMQTGYVFNVPKRNGGKGRMTSDQVSKVITKIGKRAGVIVNDDGKAASAHDLRRSFGQRLADAGVALRDLQKIMRHTRIETTEQYYLRDNAVEIGQRIAQRLSVPEKLAHSKDADSGRMP